MGSPKHHVIAPTLPTLHMFTVSCPSVLQSINLLIHLSIFNSPALPLATSVCVSAAGSSPILALFVPEVGCPFPLGRVITVTSMWQICFCICQVKLPGFKYRLWKTCALQALLYVYAPINNMI